MRKLITLGLATTLVFSSVTANAAGYKMANAEANYVDYWYKPIAEEDDRYEMIKDHYGNENSVISRLEDEEGLFPDAPSVFLDTVSDAVDIDLKENMYVESKSYTKKPVTIYFKGKIKIKNVKVEPASGGKIYHKLKVKKSKGYVTKITVSASKTWRDGFSNEIICYGKNNKEVRKLIYSQTLIGQD